MEAWVYDIEDFPNLFMVSFIPLNAPIEYIKAYIAADKAGNEEDKKILLQAMNAKTFVVFKGYGDDRYNKDDRWLLHDFLRVHKIIYGYNSYGYDSIMLDILQFYSKLFSGKDGFDKQGNHFTTFMNGYSQRIIDYGKGFKYTLDFYKHYKRTFTDRDIQKILYLDKSFTGLKKVAINLKWYRIQELPLSPYAIVHSSDIEKVKDYNINDVLITLTLILDQKAELEIREVGSEEFGINLNNMSRSSIGKALVTKYYSEITKIPPKDFTDTKTLRYVLRVKDLIDPKIKFKTAQFSKLYNAIYSSIIHITADKKKSAWGFSLLYNGTKYIIAKGGLHSKDNPKIYDITKNPNLIMRDADVTSFYPKTILNLRIAPEHLQAPAFLAIVDYVMTSRVKAKNEFSAIAKTDPEKSAMLKKKAEIYKIAINRMYGAFKDVYDYLYDPKCTYRTTINGQLYLLMLAERLEVAGIHVISANTDGIVCLFDKSLEDKYNSICKEWEEELDFQLEFTDYEKYIRNDVNNYIAIKKGFYEKYNENYKVVDNLYSYRKSLESKYIKRKGLFIDKPDFSMGFINPVVSTALNDFYIYEESIADSLRNHAKRPDGIHDFCITQKIDKKFKAQYHTISEGEKLIIPLQQYNRFYVSSSNIGNILKYDPESRRYTSLVARQNLRLLNLYKGEVVNDIKFSYYIEECYKIIHGNKKKDGISTYSLDFTFAPEEIDTDVEELIEEEVDEIDTYSANSSSYDIYNGVSDYNTDIPF